MSQDDTTKQDETRNQDEAMKLKDAKKKGLSFREWMQRRAKRQKAIGPPADVAEILGDPPLLLGEDRDWYLETRAKFASVIKPEDCVIWMLVDDYAYLTAEILRFRRLKVEAINALREGLLLERVDEAVKAKRIKVDMDYRDLALDYFLSPALQGRFEEQLFVTTESLTALAHQQGEEALWAFERHLNSLERRRMRVLREIEKRRIDVARRIREVEALDRKPVDPVAEGRGPS